MLGTLLGWLGFLTAVGVVLVVAWAVREGAATVRTVKFEGTRIIALKGDSSVRWTYDVGAPIADVHAHISSMTDGRTPTRMIVANPGPAAKTSFSFKAASGMVLVLVTLAQSPADGKLIAFAMNGAKLWELSYADVFGKAGAHYGLDWTLRQSDEYVVGRGQRTFLVFQHSTEWPWLVVVLDDNPESGRVTGRFLNAGQIDKLRPFATNTQAFLVIMGQSVSRDAGFVALVDALEGGGVSPEDAGSKFACADCAEKDAFRYIVFPRTDVNVASHSRVNRVSGAGQAYTDLGGRSATPVQEFAVDTDELWRPEPRIDDDDTPSQTGAYYLFDYAFETLLKSGVSDTYWKLHKYLEGKGRLTHRMAACPERNGPVARMWDAKRGWRDLKAEKPGG